jgi:steroid delta-isomerase-like uncharacterized protein
MSSTADANKAIVRRFFDEVWNQGQLAVVDEIITPDAVDHSPMPGQQAGAAGVKELVADLRAAFPDLHMALEDQVAEADRVCSRWILSGTNQGSFLGMPATGQRVSVQGIDIVRLEGGKMVEHWLAIDQLGMLQQLGVMPTQG